MTASQTRWASWALALVWIAWAACDGSNGSGPIAPATDAGPDEGATSDVGTADAGVDVGLDTADQKTVSPNCGFESTKQGKHVGDHVKNFALKDVNGEAFWLHEEACGRAEVVWMILATGW